MPDNFFITVTTGPVSNGINGYKPNMKEWTPGAIIKAPEGKNIPVYNHPDHPIFLHELWHGFFSAKLFKVRVIGKSQMIPSHSTTMEGQKILAQGIRIVEELNISDYR